MSRVVTLMEDREAACADAKGEVLEGGNRLRRPGAVAGAAA